MLESEWFGRFPDRLWLKSDSTGEDDAPFIMNALRLREGQKALDIPCGAGRVSLALARRGVAVTGIDLNPNFLSRARSSFRKAKISARFVQADFRRYSLADRFDAAFIWGGSFGYLSSDENKKLVARIMGNLKPGGRLLVDQPNREYLLRHFEPTAHHGDLTVVSTWDQKMGRLKARWKVMQPQQMPPAHSSIRLYTPTEMRTIFKSAGLEGLRMYGSVKGEPYRRGSKRLIMVGSLT
jgi:SAM-dependent methyltransferase